MNGRYIRIAALLLCMAIALLATTTTAMAYQPIDITRPVTLILNATQDDPHNPGVDIALPGATFRLYRVADVDQNAVYTLAPSFTDSGVELDSIDDAGEMQLVANTLKTYIAEKNVDATMTAVSDVNGTLTFNCSKPGLFIVLGEDMEDGGYAYFFSPVVVVLPSMNEDGSTWDYTQTADLKMERVEQFIDIAIIKSWKGETGTMGRRPKSVDVDLLCDGEVAATVQLSLQNNWKHQFTNLSAAHTWSVLEHMTSSDYEPSYSEMKYDGDGGWYFVVTNTYKQPEPSIPQTGLLWWPIPLMVLAGVSLFFIGWNMNRREKSER